jgi:hypothetical protein
MESYNGKKLSELSLQQLHIILKDFEARLSDRIQSSSHEKFNKMDFPTPNHNFLKLKSAIEEEIRNRTNA